MNKVLILASVSEMIEAFLIPSIDWLQNKGCEVHVATNFSDADLNRQERNDLFKEQLTQRGVIVHPVPMHRDPFHPENRQAYQMVKQILASESFALVHCHTPIGGVLARLAARKSRQEGTKVIYTAHGFHFFKGASLKNWLLYYPTEKLLSRYTDCLITINQEDYQTAQDKKFKTKVIELISGVGINPNKFSPVTQDKRNCFREVYGYKEEDFILIYVAELSYRKHQDLLISIMAKVVQSIPNAKLLLVGDGDRAKEQEYALLIEDLKVWDSVKLLGYRRDVYQLMSLSDLVVSASRQEGLPVNVMEAMSVGLPLIVTDCRGNRDLVENGVNGYVIDLDKPSEFVDRILELYRSHAKRNAFGKSSLDLIKKYSLENVNQELGIIYEKMLQPTTSASHSLPQMETIKK